MSNSPTRPILVTGDVFVDHLLYRGHDRSKNSSLDQGTQTVDLPGGAALLADVVAGLVPAGTEVHGPDRTAASTWPCGYAVFDWFPTDARVPPAKKVWRMRDALGFGPAASNQVSPVAAMSEASYGIIAIDDIGPKFRRITERASWPQALTDAASALPEWIVLQTQAPLAAGDLWHHLVEDQRDLARRTILVLPCPQLRSEQVRVTPGLSWERVALDLAEEFSRHPILMSMRRARYVIVRIETDGALLADFSDPKEPVFRLIFDPAHLEGDWSRHVDGRVYGYHTVFTAALIATLQKATGQPEIEKGIMAGLSASRRLLLEGHGPAMATPAFPFAALRDEFDNPKHWYSATTVPANQRDWSIASSTPSGGKRSTPLYGLARRVAIEGTSALRGLPFQQFGKLFIVDRGEIESLRGLYRLIDTYANSGPADKPLSIAVFGAPGSGKSFGVKELTRAILGSHVPILEFNLSQFDSPVELLGLLHQVRDKVLEGHMPIVFWDEFDAKNLMWLQYLLAPMQDGRVQDGQISHPIGKCVFVFAGGTCHEFAGFGPPLPGPRDTADEKQCWQEFKSSKGPDFKSRLNGYLNVLGPNPRQIGHVDDVDDVSFPIRRALFLRAKMGKFGDERLQIDRGLLSAFLEVSRYAHGARSMEKILEQARATAGSGRLGRSHLPPPQLLELHVDAEEFLLLVERDRAFQFDVEEMAEAYHEYYRGLFGGDEFTNHPYGKLAEFLKDDNRAAARRIGDVVGLVGLYVVPKDKVPKGSSDEETRQVIEQHLEVLAEAEHDGWQDSRERNGWLRGPARVMATRESHLLLPYADLAEKEKAKDREAVRRYIEIVAKADYRIVTGPPPK